MKSYLTIALVAVAIGLGACAPAEGEADFSYESEAPYAAERTVGEKIFEEQQRK